MDHLTEAKEVMDSMDKAWAESRVGEAAPLVVATALEAIAHALIALVETMQTDDD